MRDDTSVYFEIEGLEHVSKKLKKLEPKVRKKILRKVLRKGAKTIQAEGKQNAPVLSGVLKKSIRVRSGKRSKKWIKINVQLGASDNLYVGDQFYGAFQEFGTVTQPATHFLENAYKSKQHVVERQLVEDLWELIKQASK